MPKFLIIDDVKDADILHPKGCGKGLVPPPRETFESMFALPSDIEEYSDQEIEDRIRDQHDRKASAYYIWERHDNGKMPENLFQGSWGYCWSHSTTNATMMQRAVANMPYEPLSAFMVAAILRDGRNEGGWCGESAKFIAEVGVCSQRLWPQGDANPRRDSPEVRENAKLHRIQEEWRDPNRPIYGQRLTKRQLATCLLNNQPCAMDDMEWQHSVCGVDLVPIERGSFGIRFLNSWGENWGDRGFGVKRWENVASDGAISIRTTTASGE